MNLDKKDEALASPVVVLGASGGIGSALSRRLAARGAPLFLLGRDEARLQALGEDLAAPWRALDARDSAAVEQACRGAAEELGPLGGIANCVGSLLLKPAHRTSSEEWRETLSTNLDSAFAAVRAGALLMRKTGGAVALVSSAAAQLGLPNHEAIAAAKAGIEGLTRSAAASYAPYGIRVNAVAPGLVQTPLAEPVTKNEAQAKASAAMHPLGRLGEANDVASALDWLLSPEQTWVTGQVLSVDGGLANVRSRG